MNYSGLITYVNGEWRLSSNVPSYDDPHQSMIKYVFNSDKTTLSAIVLINDTVSITINKSFNINGADYTITGVCLLNNLFDHYSTNYVEIASTIENIEIINRTANGLEFRRPAFGQIHFYVNDGNPYYSHDISTKGNLYNKTKTKLISFCADKNCNGDGMFVVPDSVVEISQGAFISEKSPYYIILPKGITRLTKGAFFGNFPELDFTGGLTDIEEGALDDLNQDRIDYKLKINSTLSSLSSCSLEVLKKWKNDASRYSKHEVVLGAPEPIHTKMLGNGLIQLSRVLNIEEKFNERTDTIPVVLNAFVSCNNPTLLNNFGTLMPIIVDSVTIDKVNGFQGGSWTWPAHFNPLYDDTMVTRISLIQAGLTQTKEPFKFVIFVHEPLDTVINMLQKANKQILNNIHSTLLP